MIVLRTPKGWTGPKEVDGKPVEGTWRSHQVPMSEVRTNAAPHDLEHWMRTYRPDELFDERAGRSPEIAGLAPAGTRRMSANPHANGGLLLRDLALPDFRDYAVDVPAPGATTAEATRVLGKFLRDVIAATRDTSGCSGRTRRTRTGSAPSSRSPIACGRPRSSRPTSTCARGRVMEVLSEHLCQGWLEGYLLTGRHGLFNCYEAFIHIIDSMFNQHAKWLKVTRDIPWRARSRRSTTCSRPTSGARTTTGSRTRTRASSTTWSTRRPT